MSDLIASYVAELESMLDGKMPEDRVERIVKEAESHLEESMRRRLGPAVGERAAVEQAIEAYGTPERVALGFLRRSRPKMWGLNPAWWAGFGALLAIAGWNFHWLTLGGYFDHFGELGLNELAGCIGLFGLGLVVIAARKRFNSNRVVLTGTLFAAALLSILVMSYWMIPSTAARAWTFQQGISRFHLDRDLPNVSKTTLDIQGYGSLLERGIREFSSAKSARDLSPELTDPLTVAKTFGLSPDLMFVDIKEFQYGQDVFAKNANQRHRFIVPYQNGVFFMVNRHSTVLQTAKTFEEAKKAWAMDGPRNLAEIKEAMTNFKSLEANGRAAQAGRLFFFQPDLYEETVFLTLILLPVFLIADGVAAWSGKPRRRARRAASA